MKKLFLLMVLVFSVFLAEDANAQKANEEKATSKQKTERHEIRSFGLSVEQRIKKIETDFSMSLEDYIKELKKEVQSDPNNEKLKEILLNAAFLLEEKSKTQNKN